jgi:hypothetical protein
MDEYTTRPSYRPSAKHRHLLYDPEDSGLLFFATADERDAAAREVIKEYLADGYWCESVEAVFVGTVTGVASAVNLRKRPPDSDLDEWGCDEDGIDWSHGNYETCAYEIAPLADAPESHAVRLLRLARAHAPAALGKDIDRFLRGGAGDED